MLEGGTKGTRSLPTPDMMQTPQASITRSRKKSNAPDRLSKDIP